MRILYFLAFLLLALPLVMSRASSLVAGADANKDMMQVFLETEAAVEAEAMMQAGLWTPEQALAEINADSTAMLESEADSEADAEADTEAEAEMEAGVSADLEADIAAAMESEMEAENMRFNIKGLAKKAGGLLNKAQASVDRGANKLRGGIGKLAGKINAPPAIKNLINKGAQKLQQAVSKGQSIATKALNNIKGALAGRKGGKANNKPAPAPATPGKANAKAGASATAKAAATADKAASKKAANARLHNNVNKETAQLSNKINKDMTQILNDATNSYIKPSTAEVKAQDAVKGRENSGIFANLSKLGQKLAKYRAKILRKAQEIGASIKSKLAARLNEVKQQLYRKVEPLEGPAREEAEKFAKEILHKEGKAIVKELENEARTKLDAVRAKIKAKIKTVKAELKTKLSEAAKFTVEKEQAAKKADAALKVANQVPTKLSKIFMIVPDPASPGKEKVSEVPAPPSNEGPIVLKTTIKSRKVPHKDAKGNSVMRMTDLEVRQWSQTRLLREAFADPRTPGAFIAAFRPKTFLLATRVIDPVTKHTRTTIYDEKGNKVLTRISDGKEETTLRISIVKIPDPQDSTKLLDRLKVESVLRTVSIYKKMEVDDPAWKGHKMKGLVEVKIPAKDLDYAKHYRPTKLPHGQVVTQRDPAGVERNYKVVDLYVIVPDKSRKGMLKKVKRMVLVPQLSPADKAKAEEKKPKVEEKKKTPLEQKLEKLKPIGKEDTTLPNYPFPEPQNIKGRVVKGKGRFKWPVELVGIWNDPATRADRAHAIEVVDDSGKLDLAKSIVEEDIRNAIANDHKAGLLMDTAKTKIRKMQNNFLLDRDLVR